MHKLMLCTLLFLSACGPAPNGNSSVSTPDAPASATPTQPDANTATGANVSVPTSSDPTPTHPVSTDATPDTSNPGTPAATVDLSAATQVVVSVPNRFFSASGQTGQLNVQFKNANGQLVSVNGAGFSYSSSRPQDFRVDANGQITALVSEGFSTITVRVDGSDLSAAQLVSVSSPTSGSSGGGGSSSTNTPPAPTQENVNGQIEFQF